MPGNQDVLMRQLHDEHASALWHYCLGLTGRDRARAEDVVQETLLRAWRNFSVLDESRGSGRGWLFTVARIIVIDVFLETLARHLDKLRLFLFKKRGAVLHTKAKYLFVVFGSAGRAIFHRLGWVAEIRESFPEF